MLRKAFFYLFAALVASVCAIAINAPAKAGGPEGGQPLKVTGRAEAPIGYVQFCADHPGECAPAPSQPRRVVLSAAVWSELNRINTEINAEITPATDLEIYGVLEHWTFPEGIGDCEDYVLLKRQRLIEAGWPRETLLISVVRDEKGEGHAVLTVTTDRGDFVLDNQRDDIRAWHRTGYSFVKRQSQNDVNRWVYVGEPNSPVGVASAR